MLERPRVPEPDLLSLSPTPRPSRVLWAPKGLECLHGPSSKASHPGKCSCPGTNLGMCWEGCCALHPARPGVGQSLVLPRDSEGQNPWDLQSQALGQLLG